MTKQFKELAAFKEKKERLEQLTVDLEVQITEKTTQKNALLREREDLIIAEAIGDGKPADAKRIAQIEKEAAAIDTELKPLRARLEAFKERRTEALAPLLDAMIKGYFKERDKLEAQADEQFTAARKALCEYLILLQKVGQVRKEAKELKRHVDHLGGYVEPDFTEKYRTGRDAIPLTRYNLFYDDAGEQKGIRERDQKEAIDNGTLPPFAELYKLNGELADTHGEANARIREILAEQSKEAK